MSGKFKAVTYQSRLGVVSIDNNSTAIDFKEKEWKIRTGNVEFVLPVSKAIHLIHCTAPLLVPLE